MRFAAVHISSAANTGELVYEKSAAISMMRKTVFNSKTSFNNRFSEEAPGRGHTLLPA
jgi:hypothetical protein